MITLCLRFIAVFVVLFFIQLALQLASRVVRRIEAQPAEGVDRLPLPPRVPGVALAGPNAGEKADKVAMAVQGQDIDHGTLAAVGMALELEMRASRGANGRKPTNGGKRTSAWAVAGRISQTGVR